jgi:hypothetical protein
VRVGQKVVLSSKPRGLKTKPGAKRQAPSCSQPHAALTTTSEHTYPVHSAIMSALPRSIGLRLLPLVARPTVRSAFAPQIRHYAGEPSPKTSPEDAPSAAVGEAAIINTEGGAEALPSHTPDYDVSIDYRVS